MPDRRFDVVLPTQGWWLTAVCVNCTIACLLLIVSGWVPLTWETSTLVLLAATVTLGASAWAARPRPIYVKLTDRGISRTMMPGDHDDSFRNAFTLRWDELKVWQFVPADEGMMEHIILADTAGRRYIQEQQARPLSEELRLRAAGKEYGRTPPPPTRARFVDKRLIDVPTFPAVWLPPPFSVTVPVEVHLHGEGLVIPGHLCVVGESMPERQWREYSRCDQSARWRCPCGHEIDTAAKGVHLRRKDEGYFLHCPQCGRYYFHNAVAGTVEGGRPETDIDPALLNTPGTQSLSLIGCPEHDIAEMPQRFFDVGVTVRPQGMVEDGDSVVFCISCNSGPMPGTKEALIKCNGKTIRPVALVMTRADTVDDDSLMSLVRLEDSQLLCQFIPREVVERLPVYYDFDPGLIRKLLTLVARDPQAVQIAEQRRG